MPLDIASMLKHDKNAKRNRIVDEHKRSFGTKFILLPNPMYGDWESNLAKKYRKLPPEQRIALRKAALKSFEIRDKRK
jgi:predicted secreted acid phosphatase